jgi:arylsulfatase A-like enzyme
MYDPTTLPEPARQPGLQAEASAHPFLASLMEATNINSMVGDYASDLHNLDMDDVQTLRSVYLGLTTEVDAHIGRVMSFLKETGQWDNTLVVVTADHGEMLGDHHSWGKGNIYDAAYHTPLIIRDPDSADQHGQIVDAFTESVDVTPTILDWIGNRVPVEMDGASLSPFLQGKLPEKWRDYSFSELDFGNPETPSIWQRELGLSLRQANVAILREDQFKLVHFNGGLPALLFDLNADPTEMENLANDPKHSATLLRMTQKMLNHRMEFAEHSLSDMQLTEAGVVNFPRD